MVFINNKYCERCITIKNMKYESLLFSILSVCVCVFSRARAGQREGGEKENRSGCVHVAGKRDKYFHFIM